MASIYLLFSSVLTLRSWVWFPCWQRSHPVALLSCRQHGDHKRFCFTSVSFWKQESVLTQTHTHTLSVLCCSFTVFKWHRRHKTNKSLMFQLSCSWAPPAAQGSNWSLLGYCAYGSLHPSSFFFLFFFNISIHLRLLFPCWRQPWPKALRSKIVCTSVHWGYLHHSYHFIFSLLFPYFFFLWDLL